MIIDSNSYTGAEYFIFSDECQYCSGKFGSICSISLPSNRAELITKEVEDILNESNVKELKWNKLSSARNKFASIKALEFCVKQAIGKNICIDTIIWDRQDSRHNIKNRDDIKNFQIMYYHLFVYIINKRWATNSSWFFYPDENSVINWKLLKDLVSIPSYNSNQYFIEEFFALESKFNMLGIKPVKSENSPLTQLADLYSGLVVFSHEHYERYKLWLNRKSKQQSLFDNDQELILTNSEEERFKVLEKFNNICKKFSMGVSLDTKKGLWTPNQKKPINFWIYTPQSDADKAPQKTKVFYTKIKPD